MDPSLYKYASPLEGYQGLPPLPKEFSEDGKSYVNPPAEKKSDAYKSFVEPITNGRRGGFDVHIYFLQSDGEELNYATELWERIRREFPELRIYRVWDKPIGPHPLGMFEVNIFTPGIWLLILNSRSTNSHAEQFGAFIPWLVINRGPLSALIHPNTDDEERDHTQRATWMGQPYPLSLKSFKRRKERN
ncbi:DOPA-like domain-containing protein [Clohesyomyces aquaticus]|uniref:DOPA-like domain-containing protein n=1 Tax=Clohesyomyces aquaticus TaxID=1231657 RepID=A0A1Y1ZSS9_9PLEO|nr:DOPA-like domain-containing protein [Clohesyomyces aquaticus]